MIPSGLKFTKDHEWVLFEGENATVGITEYAQHALGDIVFVELPVEGDMIEAGGRLAVVESVKAASDVFCACAGKVIEANAVLEDAPEKLNEQPWDAWIAKIRVTDKNEGSLMDAEAYEAFCTAEEANK